jgi:hypothetical protein
VTLKSSPFQFLELRSPELMLFAAQAEWIAMRVIASCGDVRKNADENAHFFSVVQKKDR